MENKLERGEQNTREHQYQAEFTTPPIGEVEDLMKVMLREMTWFFEIVDARIKDLNEEEGATFFSFTDHPLPELPENDSAYTQLVKQYD
ncbi:MAG: hypothetical protein MI810_00805, partial [Flavobacteriales bacterium]|nr:hypothetical protein [Flavobacteriales bacterium]